MGPKPQFTCKAANPPRDSTQPSSRLEIYSEKLATSVSICRWVRPTQSTHDSTRSRFCFVHLISWRSGSNPDPTSVSQHRFIFQALGPVHTGRLHKSMGAASRAIQRIAYPEWTAPVSTLRRERWIEARVPDSLATPHAHKRKHFNTINAAPEASAHRDGMDAANANAMQHKTSAYLTMPSNLRNIFYCNATTSISNAVSRHLHAFSVVEVPPDRRRVPPYLRQSF